MSEFQVTFAFNTAGDPRAVEKCDTLMEALVDASDPQIFDPAISADLGTKVVTLQLGAHGSDRGVVEALCLDRVVAALRLAGISHSSEIRSQRSLELLPC